LNFGLSTDFSVQLKVTLSERLSQKLVTHWIALHSLTITLIDEGHTVLAILTIILTLWRPLLPYGYSYKASSARPG